MQLSDYLILAGVALLIIAALRACFKRRKKGGCSCGCGCGCCSGCESKDKK
ncbi:MAG: FeoB-associated Cys-rich membrane protein [Oscillospiraceae bacterium]